MSYQTSVDDTTPPPRVVLRSITKKDFELCTGFAFRPKVGSVIAVPTHPNESAKSTDLASVPPLLWGLLPSYGRQLRAALLHDRLCDVVNQRLRGQPQDKTVRTAAYKDRRKADDLFLEAMRDPGDGSNDEIQKRVGWFRSRLFWTGVCYGRYWRFRRFRAILMTLQVLAGVLALAAVIRLPVVSWIADRIPWHWVQDTGTLLLIWVGAFVLSVAWGRDWKVPAIALIIGVLILPVLLMTFVVQLILGLPDWVLHKISPDEQPPANFGPTAALVTTPSPAPAAAMTGPAGASM